VNADPYRSCTRYYGSTGRVLGSLDFYATRVPHEHLSVGMSSSFHPSTDGFIARFQTLRMYGITDVSMFMMPTTETWMPWLRKWKTGGAGCGGEINAWSNVTCY